MIDSDATMVRLGAAIALSQTGDRPAARDQLAQLWRDAGGESADPLHRCGIAHALADVQDDPADELWWDLQALAAADLVSDQRAVDAGAGLIAGFYPSLHLNLGDCYRRLGDVDNGWLHVHRGLAAVRGLPESGYRQLVLQGLERLAERLRQLGTP
jgi:hypothetical protein